MATVGIIGSGIAGIAASLRMKSQGHDVHVFEVNGYPGGKMDSLTLGGYRFDMGPSLFTLPFLVDELYGLFGMDPREHFNYIKKESICNYFWEDGTRFTAFADRERFIDNTINTFDVNHKSLKSYLDKSSKKFNLTSELFLEKSLHKLSTFTNTKALKAILSMGNLDLFSQPSVGQ